jgi:TetR/AcrR family transcriptional regulator, ethionamide resistance regulator
MTTGTAPAKTPGKPGKRRRRSPELAEREILDAAESFLRERPFRDLTVDEVMAGTTLSRPSFYVYFRGRHQLAMRLVEGIGAELFGAAERWLGGDGDPRTDMRASLEAVASVYFRHGLALGAIADASEHDPEVEAIYRGLIDRFIDAAAKRIGDETSSGQITGLDARETARALVWMSERYFTETLGRLPQESPEKVVETLATVWLRALYGAVDPPPAD